MESLRRHEPRTFVHIGYHKTGSTFFQAILFPNHPELMYVDRADVQKNFLAVGSLSFDPEKVQSWLTELAEKANSVGKHVVISEEELSGNIHTGGGGGYVAKEVADRLRTVLPSAEIIIFIRNQYEMIESCYRQYVKKGGALGIRDYLFNNGLNHRFPGFSFEHFEYYRLIEYYIRLFGRNRVHVFLYDEMKKNRDSFLAKFWSELGLMNFHPTGSVANGIVNPSYSCVSVFLARFTNRFSGSDPINTRVIFHVPRLYTATRRFYTKLDRHGFVQKLDSKYSFLDESTRAFIKEKYAGSNERLSRLLDIPLEPYRYPTLS